ncbi:MAG TPA: tRNA pseudouridine(13) synthase TruD [Phycisphaerae bacterium]|nr:tRNA pseudouridine(13) synthase TruD [Phycisphaerae bacterium]
MHARPYLTADLPGIGGTVKHRYEDFQVHEIPRYEPSGTGTHTYFCVEKAGLTTEQAVRRIASALNVRPRDVGYAGLKDAHAVTRQVLSLEHVDPQSVERLDLPGIRILWVNRHTNKLKLGHLAGNRFTVLVRDADDFSVEPVRAVLDVLARRGMPNYFGRQRFGHRGHNAEVGLAALGGDFDEALAVMLGRPGEADTGAVLTARQHVERGDYLAAADTWPAAFDHERRACRALARCGDARRAWQSLDWKARRLYLSALQSDLFNRVVAARIENLDRLMTGDLAVKHVNGVVFPVADSRTEQPRCEAFEISPTGPLFGRKMRQPTGLPFDVEARALAEAGLSPTAFTEKAAERMDGTRRPLRVRPQDAEADTGRDDDGPYVRIRFSLPPGAYATTLLREVCKTDSM